MKLPVRIRSRVGFVLASVSSLLALWLAPAARSDTDPRLYAVQASAVVQESPAQIQIVWPADSNATGYSIARKNVSASSWEGETALPASATSFTDSSVSIGVAYEYQVKKTTSVGYAGFGYVCAGIRAPLIESRGKLILLVDSLYAAELSAELARLQQDLIGDGWIVLRHEVSRDDSPANIKNIIHADYAGDPSSVQAVFLFGHVPVPYSGNLNPDGHPNHQGAWPADVYYGDMNGSWTDGSVNNTSAERQANWNVPGDGKFDQSELPADVELEVGRVDLSNLTCFANKTPARSEKDLLRQYLNKDHLFRHGGMNLQRRGLVCDNFGEKSGEAFAASGWRNFSSFFGAENVTAVPGWKYFSTLSSQSYLCSYGCGGGSYYTCDGIGSSDDFATTDIQSVFTLFLGSYYGDWDNESNFLRAPLGSTSCTLAAGWAGRPHWFLHHMALGETIGYGARLSQRNHSGGLYSAQNYGTHGIHVALQGDPTLRLHPVIPPASLSGAVGSAGVTLQWSPSSDSNLQGYHVYRAGSPSGPFLRITGTDPAQGTTFTDASADSGGYTYMVRAIKLERSGGGTYLNPSQGIFWNANGTVFSGGSVPPAPTVPAAPSGLSATATAQAEVDLTWSDPANDQTGFLVERKTDADSAFSQIATVNSGGMTYSDLHVQRGTVYVYRVRAFSVGGNSSYSNEASVTTAGPASSPASAILIATDSTTSGNWSTLYGKDGFNVVGNAVTYPSYAAVSVAGKRDWVWLPSTSDSRALQKRLSTDRIAACWDSDSSITIDVDLRDEQSHRVALYCLDWDGGARSQLITVRDAVSGTLLSSYDMSQFDLGTYVVWNLTGHVLIDVSRDSAANAVLSGLFFDPPAGGPETVATPTITPDGGAFTDPIAVTLTTATAGAVLHYTLDGSEPTQNSPLYTAPLVLSETATVKAKGYKSGMTESATSTAAFSGSALLSGLAKAVFVRSDNNTAGNWKGVYGTDGYNVIGDNTAAPRYPGYVEFQPSGQDQYFWSDATTDQRALQKVNGADRVAACWFQDPGFVLDLNFADGRTHRLTLYALDWDQNGREETIELSDAATGTVVETRTVSNFGSGTYLVWDVKGHFKIRLQKSIGNNALLTGIFFDPTTTQLSSPSLGQLSVASPTAASASFQLKLSGQAGQRFVIQSSADLVNWVSAGSMILSGPTGLWTAPDAPVASQQFYRAILASPTSATTPASTAP